MSPLTAFILGVLTGWASIAAVVAIGVALLASVRAEDEEV